MKIITIMIALYVTQQQLLNFRMTRMILGENLLSTGLYKIRNANLPKTEQHLKQ